MAISRKLGNKDHYNPISLQRYHDEKELRDEYRRYRDITRKRLERLENNDLLPMESIYNWRNVIADKPKDLNKHELALKLSAIDNFLDSPASTVTGARQKQKQFIETMEDKGYTFLNKSNVNEFINFMSSTRNYRTAHSIGSPDVVETLEATTNAGIPIREVQQNFTFYLKNMDKIQKAIERSDSKNPLSTKQLKEMLNKGKKNTSRKKLESRKKQKNRK